MHNSVRKIFLDRDVHFARFKHKIIERKLVGDFMRLCNHGALFVAYLLYLRVENICTCLHRASCKQKRVCAQVVTLATWKRFSVNSREDFHCPLTHWFATALFIAILTVSLSNFPCMSSCNSVQLRDKFNETFTI